MLLDLLFKVKRNILPIMRGGGANSFVYIMLQEHFYQGCIKGR